jgi:hypothetical protein
MIGGDALSVVVDRKQSFQTFNGETMNALTKPAVAGLSMVLGCAIGALALFAAGCSKPNQAPPSSNSAPGPPACADGSCCTPSRLIILPMQFRDPLGQKTEASVQRLERKYVK